MLDVHSIIWAIDHIFPNDFFFIDNLHSLGIDHSFLTAIIDHNLNGEIWLADIPVIDRKFESEINQLILIDSRISLFFNQRAYPTWEIVRKDKIDCRKCLNGNQTLILCKCLNENQTLIFCKLFTLKVRVYLVVNLDNKLTVTFKVHHIILWRILNITFLPRRIHRVSPNNNMDFLRKVCTFWRSLCYIKEPPQNCIINIVSQFILVTQG